MNREVLNKKIRSDITQYVTLHGKFDTRQLIKSLALKYSTTRQRISGNLSFVVTRLKIHQITTIIPSKQSYIH